MSYIDEGHTLHRVIHLLSQGGLDPGWYYYPSLLMYLITAAVHLAGPLYLSLHGHGLIHDLSTDQSSYYDVIEPPELVLIGRVVVLLFGLGTVGVVGLLAYRIAGSYAGVIASLFAATVPVLVKRSAIVAVDTPAAFFVVVSLYFTHRIHASERRKLLAFLAGLMAGFAFATKYPSGAVFVAVVTTICAGRFDQQEKLRLLLIGGGGLLAGISVGMPSIILNLRGVLTAIREQAHFYLVLTNPPYWQSVTNSAEIGILSMFLAGLGLVLMIYQPRLRATALGWLAFSVVLILFLSQFRFQEIRNLVPLVPIGCISAGVLLSEVRRYQPKLGLGIVVLVMVCTGLFIAAVVPYLKERRALVDSRVQAVDWLASHVRQEERVLVMEELAILPRELGRIRSALTVAPLKEIVFEMSSRPPQYVVFANLDHNDQVEPEEGGVLREWTTDMEGVEQRVEFGTIPSPLKPYFWHTNDQKIVIVKLPLNSLTPTTE
jgi:hypothetical protein